MAYTLAYLTSPVPGIPDPSGRPGQLDTAQPANHARPPDRREHFGTEDAAYARARTLFPAADWLDLRLYGPDGRLLATQGEIAKRIGADNQGDVPAFEPEPMPKQIKEHER